MKVIKPSLIADASLISSTVPETEHSAYGAGTSYTLGARVIYQHVIYECIQTPNTGNTPLSSPLFWAAISPSNQWAMFDSEVSTASTLASPLTVVIKPGLVNSLALFGMIGALLTVTVRNGLAGPVVYSASRNLDEAQISDWYQYHFEPAAQKAEVMFDDLPPYRDAHITITLSGAGSVSLGTLVAGTAYDLGDAQWGAVAGIIDYSKKETNAAGVTTFVRRKYSKRLSVQTWVVNGQINKIQRILADLRATPCAWSVTNADGYEPLIVFGFYRDFSINVAYPTTSYCNLEIEGLV